MDEEFRSLLLGDALGLPPEDARSADFYSIAFKAAQGDFLCYGIKTTRRQLQKEALALKAGLWGSRYLDAKDKTLCTFSDEDTEDEEFNTLRREADFYHGNEGMGPGTGLKKSEYLARVAVLGKYDMEVQDLRRAQKATHEGYRVAHREVRDYTHVTWQITKDSFLQMQKTILDEAPDAHDMKRMLLHLAKQVDRNAALSVEALGIWYIRTPAFFYENGLTDFHEEVLKRDFKLGDRHKGNLPEIPSEILDLPESQAFRVVSYIDRKVEEAAHQDDTAICQLLALAGANTSTTAFTHLVRIVAERHVHLMTLDNTIMFQAANAAREFREREKKDIAENPFEPAANCSMIANWPTDPGQPNEKGYTLLTSHIDSMLSGSLPEKINNAYSRLDPLPQETECQRKLRAIRANLLSNFKELRKKDPLVHITPCVVTALLTIAERGLNAVRVQVNDLYFYENRDFKHWMVRRQAAAEIVEMCKGRNEIAFNVLVKYLIRDPHWMIRQMSLCELAQVIGQLSEGHESLHPFVNVFVGECFFRTNSDIRGGIRGDAADEEIRDRKQVQHAALMALAKELPYYSDKTREIVLNACRNQVSWDPAVNQPLFDQVMAELGRMFPQRSAEPSWLRLQREELHKNDNNKSKAESSGYSAEKSKNKTGNTLRAARQAQQAMYEI